MAAHLSAFSEPGGVVVDSRWTQPVLRSVRMGLDANAQRFTGFAGLYDEVRPTPPATLAEVLRTYAGGGRPRVVVDLGSGTGLSTRWAATWAERVVGVEPSDDMRARASSAGEKSSIDYRAGWSHDTGLVSRSADVVLAVQALHWMDPSPTFEEAARLLRPGGVFAAVDCDFPPIVGSAQAEAAWRRCRGTVRVYEERLAAGLTGDELRTALGEAARTLPVHFGRDAPKGRQMAEGVQSWSKDEHLKRMTDSGRFAFTTELAMTASEMGDADRFVGLLRSQGDFQTLRKHGLDDELLGLADFEVAVRDALGDGPRSFWFTYRIRVGVTGST